MTDSADSACSWSPSVRGATAADRTIRRSLIEIAGAPPPRPEQRFGRSRPRSRERSHGLSHRPGLFYPRRRVMQDPWLGEIALVAFNFAPQGWALCNGQLLSIAQNTALFSLLGTTYVADAHTPSPFPDLRARAPP